MKKLFYISSIALSLAFPTISLAQQGTELSEQEYDIVLSTVCDRSLDKRGIVEEVMSEARDRSINPTKVEMLKGMALGLSDMPSEEKNIICQGR